MGWADERPQGHSKSLQSSEGLKSGKEPIGNGSVIGGLDASASEARVSGKAESQRGSGNQGRVPQNFEGRDGILSTRNVGAVATPRSRGASSIRDVANAKVPVAKGLNVRRDPLTASRRGSASAVLRNDTTPRGQHVAQRSGVLGAKPSGEIRANLRTEQPLRTLALSSNSSVLGGSRRTNLGSPSTKMTATARRDVRVGTSRRELGSTGKQKDAFSSRQRDAQQDRIVNPSKFSVRERAAVGSLKHESLQQRKVRDSINIRDAGFGEGLNRGTNPTRYRESGAIRGQPIVPSVLREVSSSRGYEDRQRVNSSSRNNEVRVKKGDLSTRDVIAKTKGQMIVLERAALRRRDDRPMVGLASNVRAREIAIRRDALVRQNIVDRLNRVVASAARVRRAGGSTRNAIQQLELASRILEALGDEEDYGGISEILGRDGGVIRSSRRGPGGLRRKLKGIERAIKAKKDKDRRDKRGKKRSGEAQAAGPNANQGAVTGTAGSAQATALSKIVSASSGGPSKSLDIFQAKSDDEAGEPQKLTD